MKSIALALEKLNVAPKTIASVTADTEKLDARSLLNELLIRGLWRNVMDEREPAVLHRYGGALERLLASGVDINDLADAVREIQVDTIYNVAQLIDWPTEGLDLDDELELEISVGFANLTGKPSPIHEIHASLMEQDPAGRHGAPRSLELRQFQMLDDGIRDALRVHLQDKKFSAAALLWKTHVGGDTKSALAVVQSLREQLW